MDEKNVWTESISARQARKVARALQDQGYSTATIGKVRELAFVINVARYFEPGDADTRSKLLDTICEAAEIKPRKTQPQGDGA